MSVANRSRCRRARGGSSDDLLAPLSNVTVVAPSPFEAGFYSGQVVCTNELIVNSVTADFSVEESDESILISENGLPIENGREAEPGLETETIAGDLTLQVEVTSVTTLESGYRIGQRGDITINDGATNVRIPVTSTDTAIIQADGSMRFTSSRTGFVAQDGTSAEFRFDCEGVLVRD